ncbi:MAG TPA: phosphoesterase, partial [Chitinophagaceae bacterium]
MTRFNPYFFLAVLILLLYSCGTTHAITGSKNYHSFYDDSSLSVANDPVLLPYNRFLNPAGKIIRFGDIGLENHSLDCITIPNENVMVVEDRYGLTFINFLTAKVLYHLTYESDKTDKDLMSTYSGLKLIELNNKKFIFWGAANLDLKKSYLVEAEWNGNKASITDTFSFAPASPAPLALPNDISLRQENGEYYIYVVLNGNNQLVKMRLSDKKIVWTTETGMAPFAICLVNDKAYVTNWGGPKPTDTSIETAGIPYGAAYIDHATGASLLGSVSVIDTKSGKELRDIQTGLHPNAIIADKSKKFIYVANGNSDDITIIGTNNDDMIDSVSVRLNPQFKILIGDSPNAIALGDADSTLYVANGMDNALAVVHLGDNISANGKGKTYIKGFIPTGAYPSGIAIFKDSLLLISNLEGEGARTPKNNAFNSHLQQATVSVIPIPG